jgi:uncharacterized protein (TIGR03437 family)
MLRGLLLLFLIAAVQAIGGTVQPMPSLPNGATPYAIQLDSSGNIYVAGGFVAAASIENNVPSHAFAAKLSPDGLQIVWWTLLAGSMNDNAAAMALGADNSVYITGTTFSHDFPTTAGSLQPTAAVLAQGFAAKLSPAGAVVYSTFIDGTDGGTGQAIAVDSAGHAFITGSLGLGGVFPTTPGSISGSTSTNSNNAYVIELDPTGSTALLGLVGFGGNAIALDPLGNIYAAGSFDGPVAPTTPGAFQTGTPASAVCFSGFAFGLPCTYQHIAKINPSGTQLIYATYLNGFYGATPSAMVVDSAGNLIVAGSTNSPDYPTTPGAYQSEYFGNPESSFQPPFELFAPAPAGFVTKLNASGSNLIWSTLFGGSGINVYVGDAIRGMGIDASGNILLSGTASSIDLPGLWATPVASRPSLNGEGFVARLSPDGTTLSATQLIAGSVAATQIAVRADGSAVVATYAGTSQSGGSSYYLAIPMLSTVSLSPIGHVASISDTADAAKIVSVAPGQLLSLYGTALAPAQPAQPSTSFPTSFNGVTVTFNGIAAPILYTSSTQINLQVPFGIAGQNQVAMQVFSQNVSPAVSESYILAVVERQPSVFIAGPAFSQPLFDSATCKGQNVSGIQPLALNADGTQNSCANPAASGSTVTIFLNGIGATNPAQGTGVVSSSLIQVSPAAALNSRQFQLPTGVVANFLSTATLPGSIDSIAQVQIQVTSTASVPAIPLQIQQSPEASFPVRGPGVLIWVQPAN